MHANDNINLYPEPSPNSIGVAVSIPHYHRYPHANCIHELHCKWHATPEHDLNADVDVDLFTYRKLSVSGLISFPT